MAPHPIWASLLSRFSEHVIIRTSLIDRRSFADWDKLLLIAAGYTINTGMSISEYENGTAIALWTEGLKEVRRYNGGITCGTSWGGAPTLIEGISLTVKIKTSARR